MPRSPLPTWHFALVVVRRGPLFLLTQEKKYGASWSLPGGRVERGETMTEAAVREVREETAVPVILDGIVRVEHGPSHHGARVRIIFSGHPADDTPPKQIPDEESLGAAYLSLDEIRQRPLRGGDLLPLLERLAAGQATYPLELLSCETSI
jgi:phosphatase NudJ